jgi:hypothetical protein
LFSSRDGEYNKNFDDELWLNAPLHPPENVISGLKFTEFYKSKVSRRCNGAFRS